MIIKFFHRKLLILKKRNDDFEHDIDDQVINVLKHVSQIVYNHCKISLLSTVATINFIKVQIL